MPLGLLALAGELLAQQVLVRELAELEVDEHSEAAGCRR